MASGVHHARGIDIQTLRHRLASATGGEFRRAMSDALGTRAQQLVYKGFRESRAPDGQPWKPVRRRGKPLIKTGQLRQTVVMESTERGFRVEVAAPYAKFQQKGTRKVKVAGGLLRQTKRGRFAKRSARSYYLTRFKPYIRSGITPRPMVPQTDRDLDPIWMPAFKATALKMARGRLED